jgi:hypothetical protein
MHSSEGIYERYLLILWIIRFFLSSFASFPWERKIFAQAELGQDRQQEIEWSLKTAWQSAAFAGKEVPKRRLATGNRSA